MPDLLGNFSIASNIGDPDSPFNTLYKFIEKNQFFSFYKDEKKIFLFVAGGRIYSLSETTLGFSLFTLGFFGTVGIRKLCKKYKLGKKIKKQLKKFLKTSRFRRGLGVRGGSLSDDVLHYEVEIREDDVINYLPVFPSFLLTAQQLFVKGLVKKCLEPNRFYKITNRRLMEVIERMMDYRKNNSVRIISYDALILALWSSTKPLSVIIYEGTFRAIKTLGSATAITYFPLIASVVMGIVGGVGANLLSGNLLISFFSSIPSWYASFLTAEYSRNVLALDCFDYVEKLPVREIKSLTSGEPLEQEISVLSSKPTRHETFVSTAPGQTLYYEQRTEIETLDGVVTEGTKVNGEKTVYWTTSPKKPLVTESDYIPLKDRTRTLADVKNLDSTVDREFADGIRERIQKEQIQCRVVEDFLE